MESRASLIQYLNVLRLHSLVNLLFKFKIKAMSFSIVVAMNVKFILKRREFACGFYVLLVYCQSRGKGCPKFYNRRRHNWPLSKERGSLDEGVS